METIDLKKPCPACGGSAKDISRAFTSKGERISFEICKFEEAKENLIRSHCSICGFEWSNKSLTKGLRTL